MDSSSNSQSPTQVFSDITTDDIEKLKEEANNGNVESMFKYGIILEKGDGISVNKIKAHEYIKKAAQNGHFEASQYMINFNNNKDQILTVKENLCLTLKEAADEGDAKSMFDYGILMMNDDDDPYDKQEGISYIKKSADNDFVEAMSKYATIMNDGDDVAVDKAEAVKYFKKAAEKGDQNSMIQLSKMLNEGGWTPINNDDDEKIDNDNNEKIDNDNNEKIDNDNDEKIDNDNNEKIDNDNNEKDDNDNNEKDDNDNNEKDDNDNNEKDDDDDDLLNESDSDFDSSEDENESDDDEKENEENVDIDEEKENGDGNDDDGNEEKEDDDDEKKEKSIEESSQFGLRALMRKCGEVDLPKENAQMYFFEELTELLNAYDDNDEDKNIYEQYTTNKMFRSLLIVENSEMVLHKNDEFNAKDEKSKDNKSEKYEFDDVNSQKNEGSNESEYEREQSAKSKNRSLEVEEVMEMLDNKKDKNDDEKEKESDDEKEKESDYYEEKESDDEKKSDDGEENGSGEVKDNDDEKEKENYVEIKENDDDDEEKENNEVIKNDDAIKKSIEEDISQFGLRALMRMGCEADLPKENAQIYFFEELTELLNTNDNNKVEFIFKEQTTNQLKETNNQEVIESKNNIAPSIVTRSISLKPNEPNTQQNQDQNIKYNKELIDDYISSKCPQELMEYIIKNCDNDTASSIFDYCYNVSPDFCIDLCKEGINCNNAVAHHKYAILLIFDKNHVNYKEAIKHLTESIQQEFLMSYFSLAHLLHSAFRKDYSAFQIAKEGALKGNIYSKCLLGYFTAHGIGTDKNHQKGVQIMIDSNAGDYMDRFATDVGIYYAELGSNNEEEFKYNEHAFNWFEKAFNMNKTKATINNYGICFLKGIGTEKDLEKAKEIFTLGVKQNYPESMYHLAFVLHELNQIEESSNYYKKASELGYKYAQNNYSFIKFNEDIEESIKYFKLAVQDGVHNVNNNIDVDDKQILEKDEEKIYLYMKKQVESGNSAVTLRYAIKLYKEERYVNAFNYFQLLLKINHPIAKYFIGVMKYSGQGCLRNQKEAYIILKDLSDKGINRATGFIESNFNQS